jgi:hypothetical protein
VPEVACGSKIDNEDDVVFSGDLTPFDAHTQIILTEARLRYLLAANEYGTAN